VDIPQRVVLFRGANLRRCSLEGIEPADEDLGEQEEALGARVVFMEATEDPVGEEFTQKGASGADALLMGLGQLLSLELGSVDEEAVD
jgi:hypothetical protein